MTESTHLQPIGLVVIGRNEGERLRVCLQSVLGAGRAVWGNGVVFVLADAIEHETGGIFVYKQGYSTK